MPQAHPTAILRIPPPTDLAPPPILLRLPHSPPLLQIKLDLLNIFLDVLDIRQYFLTRSMLFRIFLLSGCGDGRRDVFGLADGIGLGLGLGVVEVD